MLVPPAHVAGVPVEELALIALPVLSVGLGVLLLSLRERIAGARDSARRLRGRSREPK